MLLGTPEGALTQSAGSKSTEPEPSAGIRERSSDAAPNVPIAVRRKVLEKVWSVVNAKYFDPNFGGVDWAAARVTALRELPETQSNEAFYRDLNRMLGVLRDSHTRASSPRQVERARRNQATSVGLKLSLDGTVLSVEPGTEAERSGVTPGDRVLAIDGRSVSDRAADLRSELAPALVAGGTPAQRRYGETILAARLLRGDVGTKARLSIAGDPQPTGSRRLRESLLSVSRWSRLGRFRPA
jgi:carboxyl-terminal processing protease